MNFRKINNVYFIGIGGVGMSAIARYFQAVGKRVGGYDKTSTRTTKDLEKLGMEIHFTDSVDLIPKKYRNKRTTLVIYTPAIAADNLELNFFIDKQFQVRKRAEVLGLITKNTLCFAVAGTHGKTTTSAILGHILQPYQATSFLGGFSENYHSNLILGSDKISVVEADEYDKSFLNLSPNIACITSIDSDHLETYGESAAMENAFQEFANKVSDQLIVAKDCKIDGLRYAIDQEAEYKIFNVEVRDGDYVFDVRTPNGQLEGITFSLPGRHNLMNALAALAMADCYGVPLGNIKEALKTFLGVDRRFTYKIKTPTLTLIDDYAHHPTEIVAVYESIKEMYPIQKNIVVFQPHLFSRTRDYVEDFAIALAKFDEILLLDIYPARELPVEGVTSFWLLGKITNMKKKITSKQNLVQDIKSSKAEIIAMLGAGDIGMMVEDVRKELINEKGL